MSILHRIAIKYVSYKLHVRHFTFKMFTELNTISHAKVKLQQ